MTNSSRIESLAVNYIENCMLQCPHLAPQINKGDKEPSWDGSIRIYNTIEQTKDNMLGRVSVQVKGVECSSFDEGSISYPVEIADLKNYLNNGGTIFFVVQEMPNNKYKAFYETLPPVKIQQYLEKTKDGQCTKSIKLTPLPEDSPCRMETILTNFYIDAHKQASFSNASLMTFEDLQGNKNIEQIFFSTTKYFSTEDVKEDSIAPFLENEVYFYAKVKGSTTPEPIKASIKEMHFISQMKRAIRVGEKEFYPNCTIIRTRQNVLAKWGPGFVITFPEDGGDTKFQYKYPSLLSQRIRNQEFICALCEQKEFKIGTIDIPCDNLTEFLDSNPQKNLDSLLRIKHLLLKMHVTDDLDFSNIQSSESRDLHTLESCILDNKPVPNITICKDGPLCTDLKIANLALRIIISPSRTEKGKFDISDFFAPNQWAIIYTPSDSDEHLIMPRGGLLKEEDFLKLSNIDFDFIINEYEELAPHNSQIFIMANETLNRLLKAYDKKPKGIFLEAANKIARFLLKNETPWITEAGKLLDIYQIIRRQRKFNEDEEDMLFEIAEKDSTSIFDKLGAYLLLDEKKVAKRMYKNLELQDQTIFNESPLHRFWK